MDQSATRVIDASDTGHLVIKGVRSNPVREHACSVATVETFLPSSPSRWSSAITK
jgi:hypothetical protein